MSKVLFNPQEMHELVELVKVETDPTNIVKRPQSSHVNYLFTEKFMCGFSHLSLLSGRMSNQTTKLRA
jgi:hypothetical protein